jgi:hypothetical protein
MASFEDPRALLDTLSAPIGQLIAAVGESVAEAQRAMDAQTIANFQAIYSDTDTAAFEALRSIGYRPTWYHIPEVDAELSVALAVSGSVQSQGSSTSSKLRVFAAPVDAGYASKYDFKIEAASKVKFRIVPVPPSPAAEALRVVPALVGKTLAAARELLAKLDVAYSLPDPAPAETAVVATQTPSAGAVLGPNETLTLTF